jgi:hypothetical protein
MNQPKDRPQEPKPSSSPENPEVWLPPRLRERLEEGARPPSRSSTILGWSVMILLLSGTAAGFAWVAHAHRVKAKAAAVALAAQAARQVAIADSVLRAHVADSLVAVARADSVKSFLALPAWKRRELLLARGTPHALERARALGPDAGPFVIDAGRYLFADPANLEAANLRTRTGLPITVVQGSTAYHLYAGLYDDRDKARGDAMKLLADGALQAVIVPKPAQQ